MEGDAAKKLFFRLIMHPHSDHIIQNKLVLFIVGQGEESKMTVDGVNEATLNRHTQSVQYLISAA